MDLSFFNINVKACYHGYGCDLRNCWQQCTFMGDWCWLAYKKDKRDWVYCTKDSDCEKNSDVTRGASCSCRKGEDLGCGGCSQTFDPYDPIGEEKMKYFNERLVKSSDGNKKCVIIKKLHKNEIK